MKLTTAFTMVAMTIAAAVGATGGAFAQDRTPIVLPSAQNFSALMLPDTMDQVDQADQANAAAAVPAADGSARDGEQNGDPESLAGMVAAQPQPASLSAEMKCLAGAVYFEAKGQQLAGQLAVGRVVVNRARSGRFPDSYCGVVYQHAQFGFVRGHAMPRIRSDTREWRTAVAIAQIADTGAFPTSTEGALYFHAVSVSPGWHMTRIARLEDHIFYR